mgnify:CR=1 FL=1
MRSSSSKSRESGPADRAICTLKLPLSSIQSAFPGVPLNVKGPGGQVTAAVRRLLADLTSLFGLPAPMQKLLEEDRSKLGIATNAQYLQWLVLQRASALAASAERDGRSSP